MPNVNNVSDKLFEAMGVAKDEVIKKAAKIAKCFKAWQQTKPESQQRQ